MRRESNSTGLAVILLLVAIFSVQFGAAEAKTLFASIGAVETAALRVVLAAILLFMFWRPWTAFPKKKDLRNIFFYGVCLGAMNLTFYLAIARIPLGLAVALEFLGPLSLSLFMSRHPLDVLWAVLAGTGVALVLPRHDLASAAAAVDIIGVGLALLAGICWAAYIVLGGLVGKSFHGGFATTFGMAFAALVVVPAGAAAVFTSGHFSDLMTPRILIMGLMVAILSSALPYSLEMFSLKRLPTKTFGILMSIEPAAAALSGLLVLGERLTVTQWSAVALIMTASAGSAASVVRRS